MIEYATYGYGCICAYNSHLVQAVGFAGFAGKSSFPHSRSIQTDSMAFQQRSSRALSICVALAAAAGIRSLGFVATGGAATPRLRVARAAYESGMVNAGVEIGEELPPPPQPVIECDEGCMTAIYDCIEEGCSVDALLKLDTKLADDESKIVSTMKALQDQQKLNYSPENAGTLAWLGNFLNRSGGLRAQLQTIKTVAKDSDFVKQMMKAAAVAFGGMKKGDYPKVGVSGYSA